MAENILIMALLPLTALMLVTQVNPYQALIIRGILGAVAALVYALLGAADVALTEALVGTMLSITLYAIAVRSSMSFRLGLVGQSAEDIALENTELTELPKLPELPEAIATSLRQELQKHHLRLEPVPYENESAMYEAIAQKEIHATYHPPYHPPLGPLQNGPSPDGSAPGGSSPDSTASASLDPRSLPQIQIRLPYLYSLLQPELAAQSVRLTLVTPPHPQTPPNRPLLEKSS